MTAPYWGCCTKKTAPQGAPYKQRKQCWGIRQTLPWQYKIYVTKQWNLFDETNKIGRILLYRLPKMQPLILPNQAVCKPGVWPQRWHITEEPHVSALLCQRGRHELPNPFVNFYLYFWGKAIVKKFKYIFIVLAMLSAHQGNAFADSSSENQSSNN